MKCFNPRPARGATVAPPPPPRGVTEGFNPRPRTGGDPAFRDPGPGGLGFNPRPRTGGDEDSADLARRVNVSIRAPARGATRPSAELSGAQSGFNPRPRTGGDQELPLLEARDTVSIRAPARGATSPADETDQSCAAGTKTLTTGLFDARTDGCFGTVPGAQKAQIRALNCPLSVVECR